MPYVNIWVHTVWTTYKRKPLLIPDIREKVFEHIRGNALQKGIRIKVINGYLEHVHCIICLNQKQNIADIMQLIKGESSFWINKNRLTKLKFIWQDEYYAVSLGESELGRVKSYIDNQVEHHARKTFEEEFRNFLEENKLSDSMG